MVKKPPFFLDLEQASSLLDGCLMQPLKLTVAPSGRRNSLLSKYSTRNKSQNVIPSLSSYFIFIFTIFPPAFLPACSISFANCFFISVSFLFFFIIYIPRNLIFLLNSIAMVKEAHTFPGSKVTSSPLYC